ncbi:GAF domain-containing protein [Hymenobacter ruricola]|uniref:GAF domain-containing protein n=1 Tax=Hymenobacter ruricola TaxID=2791023 RepID=A0ABS0I1V9_9BACT|nr:GAF domain-containing protein [Hymenobacter ruricola]MBF9220910.1 GAF domain-containing protein [Hymenobacter ruricola]
MNSTAQYHPELIPAYEPQRLAALRRYHVRSVTGSEAFDTLVAIVARLFNVPVALLSLVQAEDVHFLGNAGLPGVAAVPRADSLCAVAILQDGITLFEDLLQRPCHLTTDAAAQNFNLQFYAGCALRTAAGMPIGALCVMDRQARPFSMPERTLLHNLAEVAMSLLDLRAAQSDNPALLAQLRTVLDEHVSQSLDRIDTLAGLSQWETPDSEEARAYQQSSLDEAAHITRLIQQELQATLRRLGQ